MKMKLIYHTNISIHTLCFVQVGHSGAIPFFCSALRWFSTFIRAHLCWIIWSGSDFSGTRLSKYGLTTSIALQRKMRTKNCSDRQIWAMLGKKSASFIVSKTSAVPLIIRWKTRPTAGCLNTLNSLGGGSFELHRSCMELEKVSDRQSLLQFCTKTAEWQSGPMEDCPYWKTPEKAA